jgi:two-component system sensor histidine kinase QseC
MKPIAPCLWFNGNAMEAVEYYVSVFKNSEIVAADHFDQNGLNPDAPAGFIEFRINGQDFQALNGGEFKFSYAVSFSIVCDTQEEVDHYWDTLINDGGKPVQCGWLEDKYGLAWQIYPESANRLMRDPDREAAGRVFRKVMESVKLDMAELQAAFDGR